MTEFTPLKGLRRELTREDFEELASLQCEVSEILGYIGTTEEKLSRWCRKNYRLPLQETLFMLRQDGLIEIRRAGFDQLKKSATIIQQQYNRFLAARADGKKEEESRNLAREIFSLEEPTGEAMENLFTENEDEA